MVVSFGFGAGATTENHGFAPLKAATGTLSESELPNNWRDHIDVVTRRRAKIRVRGVPDQDVDAFDGLASARQHVPLDTKHEAVIDELTRSGFSTLWIPDYHLLQTHTKALQDLIDDPDTRKELGIRGLFTTISDGRDPGTPNCFAFPLNDGAWKVYRFSPGITESETWEQDGTNWTFCYFDARPDLPTAARALHGTESTEGFAFDRATNAVEALRAIGEAIELPPRFADREARLKRHKDGRVVLRVQRYNNDQAVPGWVSQRGGWWERVSRVKADNQVEAEDSTSHDGIVRVLINAKGEYAGSYVKSDFGTWDLHPQSHCKMVLQHLGHSKTVAESIMGGVVRKRWKRVCNPFGPEYPGNRQWNLEAPQLAFIPAEVDEPRHPTWDALFKNWGRGLDKAVQENK